MKRYIVLIFIICNIVSEEFTCTDRMMTSSSFSITIDQLLEPVDFSKKGLTFFKKHIINHPKYGSTVLPHTFLHIVQFLKYGKQTNKGASFIASTFRLFTNTLKSSCYVDASSFELFLKELPELLSISIFSINNNENSAIHKDVVELLYDRFFTGYDTLKEDPELFFGQLAKDIITSVNYNGSKEGSIDTARNTIMIFLETCTNKLIWNPSDALKTWESIRSLAKCFKVLLTVHMLRSSNELHDLFISLIERYSLFLDVMGDDLSVAFFEKLKECVMLEPIFLPEQLEQENEIGVKRTNLLHHIHTLEAQARAREYGYVALVNRKSKKRNKRKQGFLFNKFV